METYSIFMDEISSGSAADGDDDSGYEVEFRVVGTTDEHAEDDASAVLAGLDLVDLINLRDVLQAEIDSYTLGALEAEASATIDAAQQSE